MIVWYLFLLDLCYWLNEIGVLLDYFILDGRCCFVAGVLMLIKKSGELWVGDCRLCRNFLALGR